MASTQLTSFGRFTIVAGFAALATPTFRVSSGIVRIFQLDFSLPNVFSARIYFYWHVMQRPDIESHGPPLQAHFTH